MPEDLVKAIRNVREYASVNKAPTTGSALLHDCLRRYESRSSYWTSDQLAPSVVSFWLNRQSRVPVTCMSVIVRIPHHLTIL